jgi:uncharacterized protein (TIGR00290 family)
MWLGRGDFMKKEIEAFCCWSGGKESALSFYRAEDSGIHITYLINMISEDGRYSRSHGVESELLRSQGDSIGVPVLQYRTTWESYEEEFKRAVSEVKGKGVYRGVFGDIDLQEHRDWIERVCKEMEVQPFLPLWKRKREDLLIEFVEEGFNAILVTVDSRFLGEQWLGRKIDREFISDLMKMRGVDLCGENGEYHSFVYDGPIFKKPVEFRVGERRLRGNHWFLELKCLNSF